VLILSGVKTSQYQVSIGSHFCSAQGRLICRSSPPPVVASGFVAAPLRVSMARHSITCAARASSACGIVRPSALAVFRPTFKGSKRTWGIFLRRVLYPSPLARMGGGVLRQKVSAMGGRQRHCRGCEHDGCNISVFTQTLLSTWHSQSRKITSSD